MGVNQFRSRHGTTLLNLHRGWSTYYASYKDKRVKSGVNVECYGGLNYIFEPADELFIWITHPTNNVQREYLRYIVQESMFSYVFITKDVDDGLKNGFELDCNYSYTEVFAGMTMLREITTGNREDPDEWEKLTGSKELAIAFLQTYNKSGSYLSRNNFGDHILFNWHVDFSVFEKGFKIKSGKKTINVSGFGWPELATTLPRISENKFFKRNTFINSLKVSGKDSWGSSYPRLEDTPENRRIIVETGMKEGAL